MASDIDEQQAQFGTAFAEASVKPPRVIDAEAPLPHYPSPRYVEKNLAPEKTLTYGDVTALANARKQAEAAGIISPEVGEHMLPMAMVEGRGSRFGPGSSDFGVNSSNQFYASPASLGRFKSMGLSVTDMTDPAEQAAREYDHSESVGPPMHTGPGADMRREMRYFKNVPYQGIDGPAVSLQSVDIPRLGNMVIQQKPGTKDKFISRTGETDEYDGEGGSGTAARVMAAVLSEKHAVNKAGTPEATVRAYNGAGPSTDAYWAKVQAAKEMLAHPRNAALMQHFNSVYLKKVR